jgi:hypothetical protein
MRIAQVVFGRAQPVDAGDAGHHDDIPPRKDRAGGRVAQLVDHFVDGGVLGNVGVAGRDVGFRLVVVVVADEKLDRVFGKKQLEFL